MKLWIESHIRNKTSDANQVIYLTIQYTQKYYLIKIKNLKRTIDDLWVKLRFV